MEPGDDFLVPSGEDTVLYALHCRETECGVISTGDDAIHAIPAVFQWRFTEQLHPQSTENGNEQLFNRTRTHPRRPVRRAHAPLS